MDRYSPEWAKFMKPGDKAPTRPSYCHPWADGVTHWLSQQVGGIRPLEPGYETFLAAPHLSPTTAEHAHVSAAVGTPHGPVTVKANATRNAVTVMVTVGYSSPSFTSSSSPFSSVQSLVALPRKSPVSGCPLIASSVEVDGTPVAVADLHGDGGSDEESDNSGLSHTARRLLARSGMYGGGPGGGAEGHPR